MRHIELTEAFRCYPKATIYPSLAAQWLRDHNTRNRRLDVSRVSRYVDEMKAGAWGFTGDPIQFSPSMVLLNGQHRLAACAESGVPLTVPVFTGISDNTQGLMDKQGTRTPGNDLAILGVANGSKVASVAALLLAYEKSGHGVLFNTSRNRVPATAIVRRAVNDADIKVSLAVGFTLSAQARFIPAAWAGFLHYVFSKQDKVKAALFFDGLGTGLGLTNSNPIYLFRERLIKNASSTAKLPGSYIFALAFKAWCAYRDGEELRCLRWMSSEVFPSIEISETELHACA